MSPITLPMFNGVYMPCIFNVQLQYVIIFVITLLGNFVAGIVLTEQRKQVFVNPFIIYHL